MSWLTGVTIFVGCWFIVSFIIACLVGRYIKRNNAAQLQVKQKQELISKLREFDFSEGDEQ